MNTIFHYDLVLVILNDKIIRYIFQAKNHMFLYGSDVCIVGMQRNNFLGKLLNNGNFI